LGGPADAQAPLTVSSAHRFDLPLGETVVGAFPGPDGSIFVLGALNLFKYDAAFTLKWTVGPNSSPKFSVRRAAIAASGDVFTAGNVGPDVVVARFNPQGVEQWRKAWTGTAFPSAIIIATDGGLYVTGNDGGPVPGDPASSTGGRWIGRYEADGTLTWLKQYASSYGSGSLQSLAADGDDTLYAMGTTTGLTHEPWLLETFGSSGASVSATQYIKYMNHPFNGFGGIALASDQKSLYGSTADGDRPCFLMNLHLDGQPIWYRTTESTRTVLVNPGQGLTWQGKVSGRIEQFAVGADSLYIAGDYMNTYSNGNNLPTASRSTFVARYDLKGEKVWFQEFVYQIANTDQTAEPFQNGGLALDSEGNVIVAANSLDRGFYLFKLKAADGTLAAVQ
jgi:hypothetical protein